MVTLRPCLLFILICTLISSQAYSKNDRKSYIVYMGDHPQGMDPKFVPSLHSALAQKVLGSDFRAEAILHSYNEIFNGFVIKLTEEEAETMAEMDEVVSVFPNKKNIPQTTRSWDFLGFPMKVKRASLESDIIVGVIDTGIWPESESFNDDGFGPPPTKWNGSCDNLNNFTCNNKLIGAKAINVKGNYTKNDIRSPRDIEGHGTHIASIIAGNVVNSASLLGYARGSGAARGGVPSARIAAYKVCWLSDGCSDANILEAFRQAILDGVDIISISLGLNSDVQFYEDAINIGSFHAMKRGILTSSAVGNSGPELSSIFNYAPWLLSVASSSTDRKFVTKIQLGNGMFYEGVSINTFDLKNKMFPLIYGGDAPNITGGFNSSTSRFCVENSLNKELLKGKIVLCEEMPSAYGLFLSGAVGMINGGILPKDKLPTYPHPEASITRRNFQRIYSYYLTSMGNATATIFKSDEVKDSLAPYVNSFSSRGPNPVMPNILKPDLAAPGANILAAYSPFSPISKVEGDQRLVQYALDSGTSMACPHAAAVAAYVKSFHPDWSPAMIKSALMTTATPMNAVLNPDAEFAYGAGLLNPVKAPNPGLVYDIGEIDYVNFVCTQGISDKNLHELTRDGTSSCSKVTSKHTVYDLNLPSIALYVNKPSFSRIFHRTVTNVGSPTSIYKVKVTSPSVIDIQVKPRKMSFTSIGEKKSFSVMIEGSINVAIASASLVWDDGTFQVRSPIVVFNNEAYPKELRNATINM